MTFWSFSALFALAVDLTYADAARVLTQEEWDMLQASYVFPNSTILLHSAIFTAVVLLLLYPPDAFVGAGITFDNLAYGFLGLSELSFLDFYCRRVVMTTAFVLCLPFFLMLSLFFAQEHAVVFTVHPSRLIHYVALISPLLALGAFIYILYHITTSFCSLPAMKKLKTYGYDAAQVFTNLSGEFIRIDAFRHSISNVSRLVITDSWLFHCSRFNFVVVKLSDVRFRVINAEDTMNSLHQALGMNQYLTVAVSLPDDIKYMDFIFKIDNVSMRDLESKLGQDRIEFSTEVRLKMSLTDKFIQAFLDQAKKNPRYHRYVKEDLEPCLGCSEKLSNVKLWRQCDVLGLVADENLPRPACMPCQCRPMWCVSCMARIFLAKQDQSTPTRWLEGTCPCPTCRATFCVMDVALLSYYDEENHDPVAVEDVEQ
ncbi:unnamed protein product [Cylicocyclus nassatus]|uniref:Transmembrane protein 129 n=1 Tax=Cylicocyclus nassatus TaxID=53992 RepID=A0AA36HFP8_CYLNA|nr:unnamed protein product [Cylicocyclus nassatus]